MYWGKHTFLSIILGEQRQKNKEFIEKSISGNFLDIFKDSIWEKLPFKIPEIIK